MQQQRKWGGHQTEPQVCLCAHALATEATSAERPTPGLLGQWGVTPGSTPFSDVAHSSHGHSIILMVCLVCLLLQEKLQSASSVVQDLDDDVAKQLHNMRADVKQAITVAGSSLRADLEAAATARQQQDAAQLKEQLKGGQECAGSGSEQHGATAVGLSLASSCPYTHACAGPPCLDVSYLHQQQAQHPSCHLVV